MELITTIEFKSDDDNFRKEISGIKNNTVRFFVRSNLKDMQEVEEICIIPIKYIRIKCTDGIQSFVRKLTDITRIDRQGLITYIFSW